MSLLRATERMPALRFPRVSGDEPSASLGDSCDGEFSPRERG